MSTNCLVTKLKGQVSNPNLVRVGEFKIACKANCIVVLTYDTYNLEGCYVRTTNGDASMQCTTLSIDTPTSLIEIPKNLSNSNIRINTTSETEIVISKKYNLNTLHCIDASNITADDLSYSNHLGSFRSRYQTTELDVSKLPINSLSALDLYSTKASVIGVNLPLLARLNLPIDSAIVLTDLVSSDLPSLIYFNNWSGNKFDSAADGASLEKFAEKLLTMYPTKTVTIERGNYIYFHGQTLPSPSSIVYKVVANSTYVSVLSGDTEMGRYDGTSWTYN